MARLAIHPKSPTRLLGQNSTSFMDWLGKELGFDKMEDWYKLTIEDINRNGGASLITKHKRSPLNLLRHAYPNHKWEHWGFSKIPKGYWSANERDFLDRLAPKLGFKSMEDWYNIHSKQISEHHGSSLIRKYDPFPTSFDQSIQNTSGFRRCLEAETPPNSRRTRQILVK